MGYFNQFQSKSNFRTVRILPNYFALSIIFTDRCALVIVQLWTHSNSMAQSTTSTSTPHLNEDQAELTIMLSSPTETVMFNDEMVGRRQIEEEQTSISIFDVRKPRPPLVGMSWEDNNQQLDLSGDNSLPSYIVPLDETRNF